MVRTHDILLTLIFSLGILVQTVRNGMVSTLVRILLAKLKDDCSEVHCLLCAF